MMKHPDLIEFRTKSDKMNFYNRKYEQDAERIAWIQKEKKDEILEKLDYNEHDPNRKHFLKPKLSVFEIQNPMRRNFRAE